MKNALISPSESVSYISDWSDTKQPIYTVIPNAERVAEVSDTTFEVAPPLFWVVCTDDVVANEYYYDSATTTIVQVPPPAPYPTDTPISTGTQTL
jgi:hypothetical protein